MTVHSALVLDRITQDPAIMTGKPVVKGTRIPVDRVLAHLAHVPDLDDLFAAYPELSLDDVRACLEYAHTIVLESFPRNGDSRTTDLAASKT